MTGAHNALPIRFVIEIGVEIQHSCRITPSVTIHIVQTRSFCIRRQL